MSEELVEPLYICARTSLVEAPDDTVILGRITIKRRDISWAGTDDCLVVREVGPS